jgi:hypothetical protein
MRYYVTCLLLLIALVGGANAEVILDQEFKLPANSGINYYHDYPGDFLAQTFTVRNTGELAGVGVQGAVSGRGQFVDALHIKVTRVGDDGFALMNEVLAEATIRPADLPIAPLVSPATITDVDLSNWQVSVTAGERLAILFSSEHAYYSPRSGPHYVWFYQFRNPHPGGEFSIYSPTLWPDSATRHLSARG